MPAGRAHLRGVRRVDVHQRDPGPCRLVGDVLAELGERPGVQRDPLGLAEPYPPADAAQVLQGDAASGAFSLGHDALGDDVVGVGGEPGFLTRPLAQEPFRGPGALRLEFAAQVPGPMPMPVQVLPGVPGPVVGGGDVRDPQVDAE